MTWRDPPTQRLLDAMRAVGSDLDLPVVLQHLVEAAVTLVRADFGALGVIDTARGGLSQLVTVGFAPRGDDPEDLGVLGELLASPAPLDPAQRDAPAGSRDRHPPMRTLIGVPVRVGGVVFGNLYLTDKHDGQAFTDDDEEVLAALALSAGVAIRHARLYEQSRRGSAWREAGRTVSTALLSGADRSDVVALLVDTTLRVLEADSVFLGLTAEADLRVAGAGRSAPAQDAALLGRLQQVLLSGRPQHAQSGDLVGFAVPLGPVGRPCGGLLAALWSTPPNPLLVEDLQEFAAQAAIALELADRRDTAEQGALLADRDRIGRDLHDLVIQRLFATGMRLQSAVRLVPSDPAEAVRRVDLAVDDLDATIRELRSTIHGLQAPLDGRPSLRARLLEAVDAGTVQLGFAPAVRMDGLLDTVLSPATAEHVLATVREALSNVARHAHARHVEVSVVLRDGSLQVVVQDDGVGPGAGTGADGGTGGSGLRNLRSRAEDLHGEFLVDRGPLDGTRVTWRVPVPD